MIRLFDHNYVRFGAEIVVFFLREALFTLVTASEQIVCCLFVCLFVCLSEIFVSFAFGRSGGFTLLRTDVWTQGCCVCRF